MKVSLNTARFLAGNELPHTNVQELVQKIGAQLGAVEEVVDFGKRYDGIVLARVATCEKHPNADKLSICTIDDGGITPDVNRDENGYIQVVCGAPNVREELYVAWIPPGVTVPATYDKDPFVLEKREIRGVVSNGMLASASELAINDDHSGLLEVDIQGIGAPDAKPGTSFKKLFGLDDIVLDIENKMFTHRPDCFGILGVTREIFGIYGREFKSPDWYWKVPEFEKKSDLKLEVRNELPELVPRFMAVAMDNIQIKPSPIWLQALLSRIGVKPINNVVDLTNYLSYVTAQPLHAYDYDKVADLTDSDGAVLTARLPHEGESVSLLNGKTIEPRKEAIMIATDKELVGIGGVMGGTSTEVDENTKRIIIECANFDMYSIRKTSMQHGLFTDAVTRFNKGQSPLQNDRVIAEMMRLVSQMAGGQQASRVIDDRSKVEQIYGAQIVHGTVIVTEEFVNSRLGLKLPKDEILSLLRNVSFACVEDEKSSEIEIGAPFWRMDIRLPEDVVEEVGRLYGFEKMPTELPRRSVSPANIESELIIKKRIREKLASFGANEVLTYSFVNERLIKKASQDPSLAFKISNALSPDLQHYRLSLTPNLLNLIHPNIKSGHDEFALFEVGKVHSKTEIDENGVPLEFGRVSLVLASKLNPKAPYYQARAYADELTYQSASYQPVDLEKYKENQLFQQLLAPFEPSRSAFVMSPEGELMGVVGEYKMSVMKAFKLPKYCSGFELFLSSFNDIKPPVYTPLSSYPSITQDICLELDEGKPYAEIWSIFNEVLSHQLGDDQAEVEVLDIFADKNLPGKKRVTFRTKIFSYDRTLQESHVNKILENTANEMSSRVGSIRI